MAQGQKEYTGHLGKTEEEGIWYRAVSIAPVGLELSYTIASREYVAHIPAQNHLYSRFYLWWTPPNPLKLKNARDCIYIVRAEISVIIRIYLSVKYIKIYRTVYSKLQYRKYR